MLSMQNNIYQNENQRCDDIFKTVAGSSYIQFPLLIKNKRATIKGLANNANLLDRMDTSNLPRDHPCYIAERKKDPGLVFR